MNKEFIISKKENKQIPYTFSTLCNCLKEYAKNYVKNGNSLTKNIAINIRDNILIDSINYIATQACCDISLGTKELYYKGNANEYMLSNNIIKVLETFYAEYIFDDGNCLENELEPPIVIIDFINYILKISNKDRIVTISELYEIYRHEKHKKELSQLKDFIELTDKYRNMLINGENVNSLLTDIKDKHQISYIDEIGAYHYNDRMQRKINVTEVPTWKIKEINRDIYGLAYAYSKMYNGELSQIEEIDKKILEMKRK